MRIQSLSFARRDIEKRGSKLVDVFQYRVGSHIVGLVDVLRFATRFQELFSAEKGRAFYAVTQVFPKLGQVVRFGKASAHANDGDAFHFIESVGYIRFSHVDSIDYRFR